MNVYFIGGNYMGCYQVRCLLPMLENGWRGNYLGLENKTKPIQIVNQELQSADVVVFHRPNTPEHHKLGYKLKQMGKKIVFDNDDTYKLDEFHPFFKLDEKGFKENKDKINNILNNFIINSDLVTTSTEFLAKEYREIHDNVKVLPNCIDPDDWDEPLRNEGDKIRIGLVGSVAYHHDFYRIKELLQELDKDEMVQLVVLGIRKKSYDKKVKEVFKEEFSFFDELENIEHTPFVPMVDYFRTLNNQKLDMMLIPRRENYFNKCKSNIKYLEASMLEIPVIAQSFKDAPYEEIKHRETGFKIKDDSEWLPLIKSLDKKKLRKVGKNAKKYVLDNYHIKDHAHKWEKAYNEITN
jgi:O-antigen biosynthesis protein